MDPKTGILYFVPTDRIAGSDPPGAEGTTDLNFFGPTARNIDGNPTSYNIQKMSDITAELADYHLDVGKTMGIRRIILESFATQILSQDVTDLGGVYPTLPDPLPGLGYDPGGPFANMFYSLDRPGGGFLNGLFQGDPGPSGGAAWAVANAILTDAQTAAGASQEQTIERRNQTFTHAQFLLLNLNFKSPVAQTAVAQIEWTFDSEAEREAVGEFVIGDIGKVALQDEDGEKSWWVLASFEDVPDSELKEPTWESQDLRSQIIEGCFNNRIVLFFLPDGDEDPYYPLINFYHKFSSPGNPVRDVKDQRHLYDLFGDSGVYGWIEKSRRWGSLLIPDAAFPFGGVGVDPTGAYPALRWMELIVNAQPVEGEEGLAPRAGGLGIYDSEAALAALPSFKRSDIGGIAIVLITEPGPHAYSPNITLVHVAKQLISVEPNVYANLGGLSGESANGGFVDIPYEFYLFRNNPHADFNRPGFHDVDQTYDSAYNPLVSGTIRVTDEEFQSYVARTARFLNTD